MKIRTIEDAIKASVILNKSDHYIYITQFKVMVKFTCKKDKFVIYLPGKSIEDRKPILILYPEKFIMQYKEQFNKMDIIKEA